MNDIILETLKVVYNISALFDMYLITYVVRRAMDDLHLNKTDSPTLIVWRKRSFCVAGVFLLLTIIFQCYWFTSIQIAVVTIGFVEVSIMLLWVSAVSLQNRAPRQPSDGYIEFGNTNLLPARSNNRIFKKDSE